MCDDFGETRAPEGNRGKHGVGDNEVITSGQPRWLEDDGSGGATMTEVEEEGQWRQHGMVTEKRRGRRGLEEDGSEHGVTHSGEQKDSPAKKSKVEAVAGFGEERGGGDLVRSGRQGDEHHVECEKMNATVGSTATEEQ